MYMIIIRNIFQILIISKQLSNSQALKMLHGLLTGRRVIDWQLIVDFGPKGLLTERTIGRKNVWLKRRLTEMTFNRKIFFNKWIMKSAFSSIQNYFYCFQGGAERGRWLPKPMNVLKLTSIWFSFNTRRLYVFRSKMFFAEIRWLLVHVYSIDAM